MQPIAIVGPGAADLSTALCDRLDGRTAVVNRVDGAGLEGDTVRGDDATDGGVAVEPRVGQTDADTEVRLASDGEWTGRGSVDSFDDLLDGLAPDHDYLVAVG
ncbi:MAG: molybdopterin synthase, partial [Halorubrum sp.]